MTLTTVWLYRRSAYDHMIKVDFEHVLGDDKWLFSLLPHCFSLDFAGFWVEPLFCDDETSC
jgi:hypothetical protein